MHPSHPSIMMNVQNQPHHGKNDHIQKFHFLHNANVNEMLSSSLSKGQWGKTTFTFILHKTTLSRQSVWNYTWHMHMHFWHRSHVITGDLNQFQLLGKACMLFIIIIILVDYDHHEMIIITIMTIVIMIIMIIIMTITITRQDGQFWARCSAVHSSAGRKSFAFFTEKFPPPASFQVRLANLIETQENVDTLLAGPSRGHILRCQPSSLSESSPPGHPPPPMVLFWGCSCQCYFPIICILWIIVDKWIFCS